MELVRIDVPESRSADAYAAALEQGDILFFPSTPFEIPDDDRRFLLSISGIGAAHHKNVAYKPALDTVSGLAGGDAERLLSIFRSYSRRVIDFTASVLPRYTKSWKIDYASFRSEEEEGRELPWKKRNDLLHVDAFPSRPTHGGLILRVFTNLNPSKMRAWMTSDPFEIVASQYASDAGLTRFASTSTLSRAFRRALGPVFHIPDRSPYDRFMLHFHDYLKRNAAYQSGCTKYRFDFPSDSTWMVFTDVVPHAVLSGQYALEQTFIVARDSLVSRERAPASILERLSGVQMAG